VQDDLLNDRRIQDLPDSAPIHAGALPPRSTVATVVRLAETPTAVADRVALLYEECQRELYSFALRGTREPEAAADVTQEAFLRLVREIQEGREPDDPRSWLFRVSSNLIVSRGRRETVAIRHRWQTASRDADDETPERAALRRERRDTVQEALDGLAPDIRTALLLSARGFTGHEIAAAIGRTEAATRTLMCRARAALRDKLAEL
jgi:RNA polymerase sigma-70 factor (ECF subfamily)